MDQDHVARTSPRTVRSPSRSGALYLAAAIAVLVLGLPLGHLTTAALLFSLMGVMRATGAVDSIWSFDWMGPRPDHIASRSGSATPMTPRPGSSSGSRQAR